MKLATKKFAKHFLLVALLAAPITEALAKGLLGG